MEKVDYRAALAELREQIGGVAIPGSEEMKSVFEEAMCGCVLLAEELTGSQRDEWEVGALAAEMLRYAEALACDEAAHDTICRAALRMVEVLYDHPRLKLRLLQLALRCGAAEQESLGEEVGLLAHNIACADRGAWGKIKQEGFLKSDPVEWSARWEEVIDEADRMAYARLEEHPRGMGFCFAYWSERRQILAEHFGIEWRTPSQMNPRVMFD